MLFSKKIFSGEKRASQASEGPSVWGLFLLVALAVWPETSAAQTIGNLICNVKNNGLSGYVGGFSAVCYIMGIFLLIRSALLFKKHTDSPSQVGMAPAIGHAVAAAGLSAFPAFATMMIDTIFQNGNAAGGATACEPGQITSGTVSMDIMMINFVKNVHQPMIILLSAIAFIVGATYIVQALLRGAKTGADPRASEPKAIVASLVFGAGLMAFAATVPSMLSTLFGGGTNVSNMNAATSIIQWSKIVGNGATTTAADNAIRAVLTFVQIVGVVSFLRGWMLLKKAVEGGQATVPQGLVHIIAGAMCINMDKMLAILDDTFGTAIVV